MSDYDLFLSHASEDKDWCEMLAERLRTEGVRVWFDGWELKPGDNLNARIDDGLEQSRKIVAVWTTNYFRDDKVWTLAESYAKQNNDVLARERPLIPLLREDCKIKPLFHQLIHIDFRNDDDFENQSRAFAARLTKLGVKVDALFFDADFTPRQGHVYQFALDQKPAQESVARAVEFMKGALGWR